MTITKKSVRLLLPIGCFLALASPAFAQGLSEGMGMMGMPKPVPGAGSLSGSYEKMYTAPHRATNRAISQSNTSGSSSSKAKKPAKPTGAVITSGDVNAADPNAANRARIVKEGQRSQELYKQAQAAETKGKLADAARCYEGSVAIKELYWAKTDKTIPEIYHKLSLLHTQLGELEKAIKDLDRERYHITQVFGPGTKHSIAPARQMGDLYQKQGDLAKSQDNYKQALVLTERELGKGSKEAMELRLIVARQAKGKEWNREAASYYQDVVNAADQKAGLVPTDELVAVLNEYADVLKKLDKPDEADSILAQAEKLKGGGATPAPAPKSEAPAN